MPLRGGAKPPTWQSKNQKDSCMAFSINSINVAGLTNIGFGTKLSEATKAKLETLGIDTANIKTEAEGQAILKMAEAKPEETRKTHASQGYSSMESIKAEALQLASQIGVSVSGSDKIDDILDKISYKINELRVNTGSDQNKPDQINQYQSKLDTLSNEFLNMQSSKAKLSNSLNCLAAYNKIYQNLN